jgi:hypothetical protein
MATLSEPAAGTHLTPPSRRGTIRLTRDGFGEMTGRWRLVRYLVAADLKRTHADTALGQAWWLLDPILQMLVYYFLFAVIFQRQTEDFLLFLFAAILPWKWFSTTVNSAMNSVVGRQGLIRQVQFPRACPDRGHRRQTFSFAIGLIAPPSSSSPTTSAQLCPGDPADRRRAACLQPCRRDHPGRSQRLLP